MPADLCTNTRGQPGYSLRGIRSAACCRQWLPRGALDPRAAAPKPKRLPDLSRHAWFTAAPRGRHPRAKGAHCASGRGDRAVNRTSTAVLFELRAFPRTRSARLLRVRGAPGWRGQAAALIPAKFTRGRGGAGRDGAGRGGPADGYLCVVLYICSLSLRARKCVTFLRCCDVPACACVCLALPQSSMCFQTSFRVGLRAVLCSKLASLQ